MPTKRSAHSDSSYTPTNNNNNSSNSYSTTLASEESDKSSTRSQVNNETNGNSSDSSDASLRMVPESFSSFGSYRSTSGGLILEDEFSTSSYDVQKTSDSVKEGSKNENNVLKRNLDRLPHHILPKILGTVIDDGYSPEVRKFKKFTNTLSSLKNNFKKPELNDISDVRKGKRSIKFKIYGTHEFKASIDMSGVLLFEFKYISDWIDPVFLFLQYHPKSNYKYNITFELDFPFNFETFFFQTENPNASLAKRYRNNDLFVSRNNRTFEIPKYTSVFRESEYPELISNSIFTFFDVLLQSKEMVKGKTDELSRHIYNAIDSVEKFKKGKNNNFERRYYGYHSSMYDTFKKKKVYAKMLRNTPMLDVFLRLYFSENSLKESNIAPTKLADLNDVRTPKITKQDSNIKSMYSFHTKKMEKGE